MSGSLSLLLTTYSLSALAPKSVDIIKMVKNVPQDSYRTCTSQGVEIYVAENSVSEDFNVLE
jgi:predicted peroxiredoxin